jgi:hypothetical protein
MANTPRTEGKAAPAEGHLAADFRNARRVSTPIIAVISPDPGAASAALVKTLGANVPKLQWDAAQGLRPYSQAKVDSDAYANFQFQDKKQGLSPVEVLTRAQTSVPDSGVLFLMNAHLLLENQQMRIPVIQAIWNLRDAFKVDGRTLVLLGVHFAPPPELAGDIFIIDDPLPTPEELSAIILRQHLNADLPPPDATTLKQAIEATSGLPPFPAEQVVSMALTKSGIQLLPLWERKRQMIRQTPGLTVWQGGESLADLKGIDHAKAFIQRYIDADGFRAIVFIDEGDKAFSGGMSDYTGDSGVAKDQVGTILSYIEDTGSPGILLAGVAGTGKTQLAKAAGATSGKPLIAFDLGAMKGGTVGSSEAQIRNALKVVTAVAQGKVLFIMTANKTTSFSPELNRRFADQFFFALPSDEAREQIWPVYVAKNGLTKEQAKFPRGFDHNWTGAEIKRACERASLFKCSVVEAAEFIVPTYRSGRDAIRDLYRQAEGRFLSASEPGLFRIPADFDVNIAASATQTTKNRRIDVN